MSDITDLCQIIHRGIGLNFEDLAEEIIAAGFHRNRTITTVEELDALPVGTGGAECRRGRSPEHRRNLVAHGLIHPKH